MSEGKTNPPRRTGETTATSIENWSGATVIAPGISSAAGQRGRSGTRLRGSLESENRFRCSGVMPAGHGEKVVASHPSRWFAARQAKPPVRERRDGGALGGGRGPARKLPEDSPGGLEANETYSRAGSRCAHRRAVHEFCPIFLTGP